LDLNNLLRLASNFIHAHTLIAIGIATAVIVVACLKPKQTFRTLLLLLGVAVAGYVIYYIGEATISGISGKEQIISK
jgi:hypothetical protein